jgi:hypothetical protein
MDWSFMAMKRFSRFSRMLALAVVASASLAAAATAQLVNGRWQPPPKNATSGKQGVIVERPATPQPGLVPNPTAPIPGNPSYPLQPVQPVQFTLVPAVIMSDGSIFANFGFGFEPVLRSCVSNVVVVGGQPQRIGSNGARIPNHGASQPQTSQLQTVRLSPAAQTGCFTRDNLGRVFVYKRG